MPKKKRDDSGQSAEQRSEVVEEALWLHEHRAEYSARLLGHRAGRVGEHHSTLLRPTMSTFLTLVIHFVLPF
jgi:hypothetical protein